jgi:HEAT repeat protein/response regulator of citrate/malate metabolism
VFPQGEITAQQDKLRYVDEEGGNMVEVNWPSFGVGFGAGVVATAAGYRVWQAVQSMREAEASLAQTYSVRNADPGYIKALIEYAQQAHFFGHRAKLQDLLVEPTFLRAPDLPAPPDEDTSLRDPFELVPVIHEYPALHTPYFLRTLNMDELGRSEHPIAIVGEVGSGRTTALLSMALRSAGFLEFPQTMDVVQAQLEEQEAKLSREEQAARIKKRLATIERAQQQYAEEAGENVEGDKLVGDTSDEQSALRRRAPIYIHLGDMQFGSREHGRRVDPAEPLVRGLQQQVGRIISMRMVQRTYTLLEEGNALLLIDGYDDLPAKDRPAALAWIESALQTYAGNHFIIAMPLDGYGSLVQMGVVPVFMRPWQQQRVEVAVQRWTDQWQSVSGSKLRFDASRFGNLEQYQQQVAEESRLRSVLDTTLHLWTTLHDSQANQSEAMHAYLLDRLPEAEEILPDLIFMATTQLDEGYFKLSHLVERALEAEGLRALPSEEDAEDEADSVPDDSILDAYFDEIAGEEQPVQEATAPEESAPSAPTAEEDKITRQRQREITRDESARLKKLVEAGILVPYRGGRYQFRHKLLTAYLGALSLLEVETEELHGKYANPDWRYALRYAAQQRDMTPLVMEQLQVAPDVLHEHVLSLTHWLRYMSENAAWRNELLKYVGGLFVAEDQFSIVRERVAAALLTSGDRGAGVIFRHALKNPIPEVRLLGCLGVGVLRDTGALDTLAKIVVQDAEDDVRVAAALGMGAMNTEDALVTLVDVLDVSEDRAVRRAVAESLAAYPQEGYLTIWDAVQSDDYLLRRTAVFGLGRIPKDWALIKLNEVFLEDDQWFVRSAVQDVFHILYRESVRGLQPYPAPERVHWLAEWAKGDLVQNEEEEYDSLLAQALEQGDVLVRALALMTAGQLGDVALLDRLYRALLDPHPGIRDSAYRGLGRLQQQVGQPIPAPVR